MLTYLYYLRPNLALESSMLSQKLRIISIITGGLCAFILRSIVCQPRVVLFRSLCGVHLYFEPIQAVLEWPEFKSNLKD
jgi:hypothetical protein